MHTDMNARPLINTKKDIHIYIHIYIHRYIIYIQLITYIWYFIYMERALLPQLEAKIL